jgi:hypothetical protein
VSRKEIVRSAVFVLLLLGMLLGFSLILDRKTACHYTRAVNGFFNEPEESMDVIFYGSSNTYCTMSPLILWDETGLRSYVLSTQTQPLEASYLYMKQSFLSQSPKLVVLELSMVFESLEALDDEVLRDTIDPLPWKQGKAELIRELVPKGERGSFYFNLAKYHGRWSELDESSFDFSYRDGRDVHRGYVCFTPARPAVCAQLSYEGVEPSQLLESNLQQLLRMRDLAAENGAELLLFISPYEGAERDLADLLALHCFCEENDIPLIDYNLLYDQLGFDGNTDFFDMNHFNVYGAEKATRYFGRWVVENLGIEASPHPADAQFKTDWDNRTW